MWLHFTTGRGPGECQIACSKLPAIFIEEAAALGLSATLLDVTEGDHGALSALVAIEDEPEVAADVAALLLRWEGTLQWTCPSPIRENWPRKNWFVSASVIRPPEPSQVIHERDLDFQAYRASGPGGQHVQKTDSAVRVIHRPTGLVAQAQEERSQHRNKALALARLAEALEQRADAEAAAVEQAKWAQHNGLQRGNPVRVFKGPQFTAA